MLSGYQEREVSGEEEALKTYLPQRIISSMINEQ